MTSDFLFEIVILVVDLQYNQPYARVIHFRCE